MITDALENQLQRSLMTIAALLFLLLLVSLPASAHDDSYGFMHCYSGKHCPQDKLVFGIIINQSANEYTLTVDKTLRGKDIAGEQIRILNSGWINDQHGTGFLPAVDAPPSVGDAIVVSYLSTTSMPYQPHYLLRSTTTDWHNMTIDAEGYGDIPAIERFVRSGGENPAAPGKEITTIVAVVSLLIAILVIAGGLSLARKWRIIRKNW